MNFPGGLCNALEIPITHTTLQESLLENPYYPILFSMNIIFEKYRIKVYFIKILFKINAEGNTGLIKKELDFYL